MKIKVIILSLMSFLVAGNIFAQGVEGDDMYFNSKDRAKLRAAQKANEVAYASITRGNQKEDENINPTDSYSARNVNPEYTSRSKSKTAQADDQNYYVSNYRNYNQGNLNNWNNNFNNWYGNNWYQRNYFGPSIYSWNSPYYGYGSMNSPWADPSWAYNGYSSSFSYYYGNSWNYGWGGSYNYWNRPYWGMGSGYGYSPYGYNNYGYNNYGYAGYGYGSNWFWNNYRSPYTIAGVSGTESSGRGVAYGKRPTRGSSVVYDGNNSRSRSNAVSTGGRDVSGGRIANDQNHTDYYNRYWRNNSNSNTYSTPNTSWDNRSNTQQNRSSSWGNSSFPSNNSSRSSTFGGGGGTRSSPSPSGGGGGSHGRGRD